MKPTRYCSFISKALLIGSLASLAACESKTTTPSPSMQNTANKHATNYLERDVRDDVFYFVMPDRFNNGDTSNDHGSLEKGISHGGLDLTFTRGFHGGDMAGIEQKLDYLQGMGITAIWMTPILRNKTIQLDGIAHHGYWIVDFTEIDPHFGTNDDLKQLISAAHKKGIKVFFDIITNHTADVIKFKECHQDSGQFQIGSDGKPLTECTYKSLDQLANNDKYTPFVPTDELEVKTPAWLNDPKYYHNQGDSTFKGESSLNGDFNGLDDLDTSNPEVLAGMIEIYQNLIKEFKPDGYRIDTVRHVDLAFWQSFSPAIVDYAKQQGIPNFHVFGEVYDSNPKTLSMFTTEGKLPSVLDFGFQKAAADIFYYGKSPTLAQQLFAQDTLYNDEDSNADLLMTFLGNHDMGRPGYFLEQAEEQGHITADTKLQRSILSHAYMFLSRGIPVIYYGDEQGFTGDGNDIYAREDMFESQVDSYNDNTLLGTNKTTADNNFDQDHPIYQSIAALSQLRSEHIALRRGVYKDEYYEEKSSIFAFSRNYIIDETNTDKLVMVFNSGETEQSLSLETNAKQWLPIVNTGALEHTSTSVTITLPKLSYAVYKIQP